MTIQEVAQNLRNEPKPYAGIMKHSLFFMTLKSIESGTAKMCTIKSFFARFNYVGDFNEWSKVESLPKQIIHYDFVR